MLFSWKLETMHQLLLPAHMVLSEEENQMSIKSSSEEEKRFQQRILT